jgi:hypothetical protein
MRRIRRRRRKGEGGREKEKEKEVEENEEEKEKEKEEKEKEEENNIELTTKYGCKMRIHQRCYFEYTLKFCGLFYGTLSIQNIQHRTVE